MCKCASRESYVYPSIPTLAKNVNVSRHVKVRLKEKLSLSAPILAKDMRVSRHVQVRLKEKLSVCLPHTFQGCEGL
jgi:hypothetical protein